MNYERMSLAKLQAEAFDRLEKLQKIDLDAYDRTDAYLGAFWYDAPSLAEFIDDFDKGVYAP